MTQNRQTKPVKFIDRATNMKLKAPSIHDCFEILKEKGILPTPKKNR